MYCGVDDADLLGAGERALLGELLDRLANRGQSN
jgi:hypothetical protein